MTLSGRRSAVVSDRPTFAVECIAGSLGDHVKAQRRNRFQQTAAMAERVNAYILEVAVRQTEQ